MDAVLHFTVTFAHKSAQAHSKTPRHSWWNIQQTDSIVIPNGLMMRWQVNNRALYDDYWFMQDGTRPHKTREVFDVLNEHFHDRVLCGAETMGVLGCLATAAHREKKEREKLRV